MTEPEPEVPPGNQAYFEAPDWLPLALGLPADVPVSICMPSDRWVPVPGVFTYTTDICARCLQPVIRNAANEVAFKVCVDCLEHAVRQVYPSFTWEAFQQGAT